MNPKARDEYVARYITQGLHAPSVHSGMRVPSEGEAIELDFAPEIYALRRALGTARRRYVTADPFQLPGPAACM
jgi:hypothetical protein